MKKSITFLFVFFSLSLTYKAIAQTTTCDCWQSRDTSFHYVPFYYCTSECGFMTSPYYRNDDAATDTIYLPFKFCFWGVQTDTVFINTNGNLTFGKNGGQYTTFSPDTFPQLSTVVPPMIAPFWGDVDDVNGTGGTDEVLYKITPHYMIVQWDSVGYFDRHLNRTNSFQLILTDGTDPIIPKGNNVEFCYRQMQWTTGDASSGMNGFGGDPATVGANQGDGSRFIQIGLFDTAGSRYLGQFPPAPGYDGVGWLKDKSFVFNLCRGTIAPLASGISPCDTFKICVGDSILVPFYFFSPVQGDSVWSNLSPPIPPGVSVYSNNPGPTDSIIIKIVGSVSNLGYHIVYVYAYDNEVPPDTTFTSFVVEVDTAPTIHLSVIKDTICVGDTTTLNASGGRIYSWNTGATTSTIKVTPDSSQYYTVGISDGGCFKDTTVRVVVLPIPNPKITAKPDTICPHDSILLIASGGGIYTWSTGKTTDSIWVKPTSSTTYGLSSFNGLCSDSTKISVYVTTPGTSSLALAKDSLCPYDTTTLTVTGGTSFRWSNGATTRSITITPGTTTTYTVLSTVVCAVDTLIQKVTVIPLPKPIVKGGLSACLNLNDTVFVSGGTSYLWSNGDTTTYYILQNVMADSTISVRLFNGKCYTDTTLHIIIKPFPIVGVINGSVCAGDCFTLRATDSISETDTYTWSNGARTDTTTVCTDSTKKYTVTVSNGCITRKSATVTVYPVTLYACCDQTITRDSSAIITSALGKSYTWTPPVTCLTPNCDSVKVTPMVTTTYTVSGVDGNGCEDERAVTITVEIPCGDFVVPNVFTPNGDGRNDVFEYMANSQSSAFKITIYDRWGKKMFTTTNLLNYWNGNTENGAKAADGVYYYILSSTCNGKVYDKQGFVQLIR